MRFWLRQNRILPMINCEGAAEEVAARALSGRRDMMGA